MTDDRDDRIAQARRVRVVDEIAVRGVKLVRSGGELVGPCPACGGDDRFSVNPRKNVFHCRKSGAGGDAIALVQYLDACDFLTAVETLAGTSERLPASPPPPATDSDDNSYRKAEIGRARKIWDAAGDRHVADRYLAWRKLAAPPGAKIRGQSEQPFFTRMEDKRFRRIYTGPAMVAAITGPDGRFTGAHITWIDPRILIEGFDDPVDGKADIVNPETGEFELAKKVRGSSRAGHIPLGGPAAPERLVVGEGIETTLSVCDAMLADEGEALFETCAFWAGVSMQNIGGKSQASIRHPTEKRTDSLGRVRPLMVPGPYPLMESRRPSLMPPDSAVDILTLGDGDSDRFTASMVHARAAARWARPGRTVRTSWAPEGLDFNDMLRGQTG